MENPTYDYGSGPINVKVIDPLNISDGYFECLFSDSAYNSTGDNGAAVSYTHLTLPTILLV